MRTRWVKANSWMIGHAFSNDGAESRVCTIILHPPGCQAFSLISPCPTWSPSSKWIPRRMTTRWCYGQAMGRGQWSECLCWRGPRQILTVCVNQQDFRISSSVPSFSCMRLRYNLDPGLQGRSIDMCPPEKIFFWCIRLKFQLCQFYLLIILQPRISKEFAWMIPQ